MFSGCYSGGVVSIVVQRFRFVSFDVQLWGERFVQYVPLALMSKGERELCKKPLLSCVDYFLSLH